MHRRSVHGRFVLQRKGRGNNAAAWPLPITVSSHAATGIDHRVGKRDARPRQSEWSQASSRLTIRLLARCRNLLHHVSDLARLCGLTETPSLLRFPHNLALACPFTLSAHQLSLPITQGYRSWRQMGFRPPVTGPIHVGSTYIIPTGQCETVCPCSTTPSAQRSATGRVAT